MPSRGILDYNQAYDPIEVDLDEDIEEVYWLPLCDLCTPADKAKAFEKAGEFDKIRAFSSYRELSEHRKQQHYRPSSPHTAEVEAPFKIELSTATIGIDPNDCSPSIEYTYREATDEGLDGWEDELKMHRVNMPSSETYVLHTRMLHPLD
jgi:hypothetical protein